MSLRKSYKTNPDAETNGIWLRVGKNEFNNNAPIEIKLSRAHRSNPAYTKVLEEVWAPYTSEVASETLDKDIERKLSYEVFARAVIKDWREITKYDLTGVEEDKVVSLPFNVENAIALFNEMPDLFDDWERRAVTQANFLAKEQTKKEKN